MIDNLPLYVIISSILYLLTYSETIWSARLFKNYSFNILNFYAWISELSIAGYNGRLHVLTHVVHGKRDAHANSSMRFFQEYYSILSCCVIA